MASVIVLVTVIAAAFLLHHSAGQFCGIDGKVRLTGGSSNREGRVEICMNGVWGGVCQWYSSYGSNNARVVCQQLGYPVTSSPSYTTTNDGAGDPVWMSSSTYCSGTESSLLECRGGGPTSSCSGFAHVTCPYCSHGSVRLEGGLVPTEGNVHVCLNGEFVGVCHSHWDYKDAFVVCRQLEYPSTDAYQFTSSYFGEDIVPKMTNVWCYGNESSLLNCQYSTTSTCSTSYTAGIRCQGVNIGDCSFSDYSIVWSRSGTVAGVICQGNTTSVPECTSGDIRLAGGSSEGEGRVEICIDGFWGTVCSSGFGAEEAVVICRQMGYLLSGSSLYNGGAFGPGQGPIMGQLTCTGRESNIDQCVFGGVGAVDCHHGIDAALTCTANTYYEVSVSKDPEGPVQIGSQVTLHCSVSPSPPRVMIQYRWTSSVPNNYIINSNIQNATVTIQYGHPKNGQYHCHTYNHGTNLLGVGYVVIEVQDLLYAATSEVLQLAPSETLTLQVGVTDKTTQYYFYHLVWYHNGYELSSSNRIQLSKNNMTLTISYTSEYDSGVYEAQYRGVHVQPRDYDKQCEEKFIDILRHYPVLQSVKFYVNTGSGILLPESPTVVKFNTSSAVIPLIDSNNITLAIEGTIGLPINTNAVTTRWTLNGESVPSTFRSGVLQKQFPLISQSIELNEVNILNTGVLEAALVIDPNEYFTALLGCPSAYNTLVTNAFGTIIVSQSSIDIQYYEPPVMTLEAEKLDLKKGEHSTLTCTATGGYPPIHDISFLKAGAVLVSTESSSLSITVGSRLEHGYGHYVCTANSAGVIREEKAKVQEKADLAMQLKFEGDTSCANWNDADKESKAMEFAESFTLVAQTRCSCDYSVANMRYSLADCSGRGGNTFTVEFTVTYSGENGYALASTVLDKMKQWAITDPTLAIDGIQATVSDYYNYPSICAVQ